MASKTEYELLLQIAGKLDSSYTKAMGQATKSAKDGFTVIKGAVANLVANGIQTAVSAVKDFAAEAVTLGKAYEGSLAKVSTIADTSVVSMDEISNAVKSLSNETGVSAAELNESVYNAISATGDTANAVALVGDATKLATAGFTDSESALSVLTTAINAYGMSADQASAISDSLLATQNLGVTTVADLSANMGKAIASASAYSVDIGNLESAYVSLTKNGISTAESTTMISAMMKELGTEGSDVSNILLQKTGKSFGQLMQDGSSLGDVLGVVYDACGNNSEAMMNMWGSAEAAKSANAVISQGIDSFNDNLSAIQGSVGLTADAYSAMTDTLSFKTQLFQNNLDNMKITLFDAIEEPLTQIVGMASEQLASLGPTVIDIAVAIVNSLSEIMPIIMDVISDVLPILVGLFQKLTPVVMKLVSTVLPPLLSLFERLVDPMMQIIDAIIPILMTAVEALAPILNALMPALDPIIDATIQLVGPLTDMITAITPIITMVGELASILIDSLAPVIPVIADYFQTYIGSIIDNIGPIIEGVKSIFSGLIEFFTGVFSGDWSKIWQGLVDTFDGIWSTVEGIFKAPINAVITMLNWFISKINTIQIGPLPDWGVLGDYAGASIGFSIPQIEYLAEGGILTQPTFLNPTTVAGEAGPEAVLPLSKLESMLSGGMGGYTITYAPVLTVYPGASKADATAALDDGYEKFKAYMSRMMSENRRYSFGG